MIHLVVFLYSGQGGISALEAYESAVLHILREHGGRLITAMRPEKSDDEPPDEIHVLEFPSRAALNAYQQDPRIIARESERSDAISSTKIFMADEIISYS